MKLYLLVLIGTLLVSVGLLYQNVNATNSALVDTIDRNGGWGVTTVDPDTNKIYITNYKTDTVTVIDGTTNQAISEINVGKSPFGIGINTGVFLFRKALQKL